MRRLTPKQKLAIALVAHGFSNQEIGRMCGSGEHTIKERLRRVYRKLDIPNGPELDKRVKLGVYLNCELFKIGLKEMQAA